MSRKIFVFNPLSSLYLACSSTLLLTQISHVCWPSGALYSPGFLTQEANPHPGHLLEYSQALTTVLTRAKSSLVENKLPLLNNATEKLAKLEGRILRTWFGFICAGFFCFLIYFIQCNISEVQVSRRSATRWYLYTLALGEVRVKREWSQESRLLWLHQVISYFSGFSKTASNTFSLSHLILAKKSSSNWPWLLYTVFQ